MDVSKGIVGPVYIIGHEINRVQVRDTIVDPIFKKAIVEMIVIVDFVKLRVVSKVLIVTIVV